jgi:hypothetical protein
VTRAVPQRPRHLAALALLVTLSAPACVRREVGVLRITGGPPDALITVDDQYVGKLSRLQRFGIKVSDGEHRLTVEAPGRFPHDRIVRIPPNGVVAVDVQLVPIPD